VTYVKKGKGSHIAEYVFFANGKKYTGRTFKEYKGEVGDIICVEYSFVNPEINIYCDDTEPETFFEDVLLITIGMTSVMIGALFVRLMFLKLNNPKKNFWKL
jgi:hypothetical protein